MNSNSNGRHAVASLSSASTPRAHASAQILGWLLVGIANIVATWLTIDLPTAGVAVRISQHVFDLGHALALGLLSWAAVAAWQRWAPSKPIAGYLALSFLAVLIGQWVLRPDLRSSVGMLRLESGWTLAASLAAALLAMCVPISAWLGQSAVRRIGYTPLVLFALLLAVGHQLVLSNLYLGIHAYGTWCAAILGAAGLQPVAARLEKHFAQRSSWLRKLALGILAAAAVASLLVRAPSDVRIQMVQLPGSVVTQWGAVALRRLPRSTFKEATRTPSAPTPRDEATWLPDRPIVVLLVVDALRASVLNDDASQIPAITKLREEGVYFPRAWSAAPDTNASVTSMFSGRYSSQMLWTPKKAGRIKPFPHKDPTPRVPELLTKNSVQSGLSGHMRGMHPPFGLTKGFGSIFQSKHAAKKVVESWAHWLADRREEPSLTYIHFIEAHSPYDGAGTEGSKYERYVREVALIDEAIAELQNHLLEVGLNERAILIVTADHGEAFGEHNTRYHGSTVYEEQVRVPLIIAHPALEPRIVMAQVSLIDMAPTLLDIFNITAPAQYMGTSLLPALQGGPVRRADPIFLDSQRRFVGMVFDDGTKLVMHESGTIALYDLQRDPQEKDNLIDQHPQARAYREAFDHFVSSNGLKIFTVKQ
jgi:arylsulfatase A-like enzyme